LETLHEGIQEIDVGHDLRVSCGADNIARLAGQQHAPQQGLCDLIMLAAGFLDVHAEVLPAHQNRRFVFLTLVSPY
jgi:hypothetical protein